MRFLISNNLGQIIGEIEVLDQHNYAMTMSMACNGFAESKRHMSYEKVLKAFPAWAGFEFKPVPDENETQEDFDTRLAALVSANPEEEESE